MHSPTPLWQRAGLRAALLLTTLVTTAQNPAVLNFQGRVAVDGVPFTGTGQFKFSLVDPAGTTFWSSAPDAHPADGVPDAVLSLEVSKGLYSVPLGDHMPALAPELFTAHPELALRVWFDDGVHGSQQLVPDQRLTAVPFALQSASATTAQNFHGTITAAQIQGTLNDTQLPATTVRLDSSPVFTGTVTASAFHGAGAVPWVRVDAADVESQPNNGYLADRDEGLVTLHLPTTAHVGDVVRISGAGQGGWRIVGEFLRRLRGVDPGREWETVLENRRWTAIASSADGTKLLAAESGGALWTSTDAGVTWQARTPAQSWVAVASSVDGRRLAAAVADGQIWVSVNSGATWAPHDQARRWRSLASSANGQRLIASTDPVRNTSGLTENGRVWWSADGGQHWTAGPPLNGRASVACSANADRLFAAEFGGAVWISEDGGGSWKAHAGTQNWAAIAASEEGTTLLAATADGSLRLSVDAGATWAPTGPSHPWAAVASSADGQRFVAAELSGRLWISVDGGRTWEAREQDRVWVGVAMAPAGHLLLGLEDGRAPIHLSRAQVRGNSGQMADTIYLGQGEWMPFHYAKVGPDGNLDLSTLPSIPAESITSGFLSPARFPQIPFSKLDETEFPAAYIPTDLPGLREFSGSVTIGERLREPAPLGIRRDTANSNFGYCLSLHDHTGEAWWKIGADNQGRFSIGAAGRRDYDLAIDRTTGHVGLGDTPDADHQLRVAGGFAASGDGNFGGSVYSRGVLLISDARMKTAVTPLTDSLQRVESLRGVSFEWREPTPGAAEPDGRQLGFIAQELAQVLPELVHTNREGFLSVNYSGVTPVLVEAVKELHREFADQLAIREERLRKLQARLARLEEEKP